MHGKLQQRSGEENVVAHFYFYLSLQKNAGVVKE
jgi:hypothetical protein